MDLPLAANASSVARRGISTSGNVYVEVPNPALFGHNSGNDEKSDLGDL
jgi:hypothetical protein